MADFEPPRTPTNAPTTLHTPPRVVRRTVVRRRRNRDIHSESLNSVRRNLFSEQTRPAQ